MTVQDYDPSNHEHVAKLAKALGFTGVAMHIGEPVHGAPGLFTNEWRGTYAGKMYAVVSPHHFGHETSPMQRTLALEINRVLLQMVANGIVPARRFRTTQEGSPQVHWICMECGRFWGAHRGDLCPDRDPPPQPEAMPLGGL